ncbi:MAG: hypothetical protein PVI77_12270 [Desulfobacterales bacterium]|jgi:hypothetical protein
MGQVIVGSIYIGAAIFFSGYVVTNIYTKKVKISPYATFITGMFLISLIGIVLFETSKFHYIDFFINAFFFLGLIIFILRSYPSGKYVQQVFLSLPKKSWIVLIVVVLSFYLRLPLSNFICQIGDAGEYVNAANSLALRGSRESLFFPLYQVWLGIFCLKLGSEFTLFANLFFSLCTLVTFYLLIKELLHNELTSIIGLIVIALNILFIWYAKMPFSETLMVFLNLNILLYYSKFAKATNSKESSLWVLMVVFCVGMAAFTRVTAIIWILILTANFFIQLFFLREKLKHHWLLLNGALLVYFYSVYHGLVYAKGYYIKQLDSFFRGITQEQIIIFHVCLFLFINIIFLVFRPNRQFVEKTEGVFIKIRSKKVVALGASIALFFVAIAAGSLILTRSIDSLFFLSFAKKLYHKLPPQDIYYMFNFFSVVSFLLIPAGLIYLFKNFNVFAKKEMSLFWMFSIFFLILYYALENYDNNHGVYLYWDRYFYSEVSIVYLVAFTSAFQLISGGKVLKIFLSFALGVYLVHSAYWLNINWNVEYLRNAYATLSKLEKIIPRKNTAVFIEVEPDMRWFFSNVRRSFLLPLHQSFGYYIDPKDKHAGAFTKDAGLDQRAVMNMLQEGRNVYVLSVSESGKKSASLIKISGVVAKIVDRFTSFIEIKRHYYLNIFHDEVKRYDFHIDVIKLERLYFEKNQ